MYKHNDKCFSALVSIRNTKTNEKANILLPSGNDDLKKVLHKVGIEEGPSCSSGYELSILRTHSLPDLGISTSYSDFLTLADLNFLVELVSKSGEEEIKCLAAAISSEGGFSEISDFKNLVYKTISGIIEFYPGLSKKDLEAKLDCKVSDDFKETEWGVILIQ